MVCLVHMCVLNIASCNALLSVVYRLVDRHLRPLVSGGGAGAAAGSGSGGGSGGREEEAVVIRMRPSASVRLGLKFTAF